MSNSILHEYCAVRQEARSWKFPEVDKERYLQAIVGEVHHFENPQLKSDMLKVLDAKGWSAEECRRTTGLWLMLGKRMTPLMKMLQLRAVFERLVSARGPDVPLWGPIDTFLQLVMYRCLGWFPPRTYMRCDSKE